MSNKGKLKYIFTSSHTKNGFHSFIPDLIADLSQVFILKGPAGSGKSTFIRLLGETMSEQGYEIEFWISAIEPLNPDGVYIPQLDVAVVNGSLPIPIDPEYPASMAEIINLGELLDKEASNNNRQFVRKLVNEIASENKKAYALLKQASIVKQEIKKITSKHLDLEKIQSLIDNLAQDILSDQPREKHYFASALTAEGMIKYTDEISSTCNKRYILKGPSGSAKSTVINELAYIFREKGFILEYYHSGLDADSIDMVIIRNLQVALIDGGNTEIIIKPWDTVIDMTKYLEKYDTDNAEMLKSESYRNYESLVLEAQSELANMQGSLKDLKKIYAAITNFAELNERRETLRMQIMDLQDKLM
ncbi:MAG TPA: P-loop NTPase fold protein [Syntrophomonadaceae bacterium]|nr:P-loop NTPase fold protein [Syntrophomonadaceae bacterium]